MYKRLVEQLKINSYFTFLGTDGRIILEWILNRVENSELYLFGSGQEPVVVSCEDGD
jgi:hypothetical protein